MTPYRKSNTPARVRFNKILSHSRVNVENTFGELDVKTTTQVVKTMCLLHNFLKDEETTTRIQLNPSNIVTNTNQTENRTPKQIRNDLCSLIETLTE